MSTTAEMLRELPTFIAARLDELQHWARDAGRTGQAYVEDGAHWQWVKGRTGEPLCWESEWWEEADLRTVEESTRPPSNPQPARLMTAIDVDAGAARHIVAHDPAATMRRVATDRQLLQHLRQLADLRWTGSYAVRSEAIRGMRAMAAAFSEHPDFEAAWMEWDE